MLELFFDEQSGVPGKDVGDAFGAGMGSVRGAKCVIYVNIGKLCQLRGESGIVGFLFGMEPDIFKQKNVTWLSFRYRFLNLKAHAVREQGHWLVKQFAEPLRHGFQTQRRIDAFRTTEMAGKNDDRTLLDQVTDRRKALFNSTTIGNFTVLQRHVKVASNKNAFSSRVEIRESKFSERHRFQNTDLMAPGLLIAVNLSAHCLEQAVPPPHLPSSTSCPTWLPHRPGWVAPHHCRIR